MADNDVTQFCEAIAKIIAQAWADPAILTALITHNIAALAEKGIALPEIPGSKGTKLTFVANTAEQRYIVIPMVPKFTDEDMSPLLMARRLETGCTDCFYDKGHKLTPVADRHKITLGIEKKNE